MKLLIAADMEGISGVTQWEQVDPLQGEYQRFRRIMTREVDAAAKGAFSAGAKEVVVADGHNLGTNILVEELDPRVQLNNGTSSPLAMVQGIRGADAAFFIGYHARAGTTPAILDHTWSSRVHNVFLNGRLIGEIGLNAAVCGFFNVPVLLISGDQSACAEAQEWVAGVMGVQVKAASGRWAAEVTPPVRSQAVIRTAAESVIRAFLDGQHPEPVVIPAPVRLGVELGASQMADRAELVPGVSRVSARMIEYTCEDVLTAYKVFRVVEALSR